MLDTRGSTGRQVDGSTGRRALVNQIRSRCSPDSTGWRVDELWPTKSRAGAALTRRVGGSTGWRVDELWPTNLGLAHPEITLEAIYRTLTAKLFWEKR